MWEAINPNELVGHFDAVQSKVDPELKVVSVNPAAIVLSLRGEKK